MLLRECVLLLMTMVISPLPAETHGDNLIQNGLFQTYSDWSLQQHSNMWSTSPANVKQLHIDPSGGGQLIFSAKQKEIWSLFASQYVVLSETASTNNDQLMLAFTTQGVESTKIKAILDLSYSDERYLFMEVSSETGASDYKTKSCYIVPSYGIIRAFMLHLVLQEETESHILLGDISVSFVENGDPNSACNVYTNTFPIQRHVITNFLVPTIARTKQEQDYDIVIVTQLTLDRLDHLDKLAEAWKGPVSAAVIILDNDIRNAVKSFVEIYHKKPYLTKYVSIHLVFHDAINDADHVMYPVNFLRNTAIKYADNSYNYVFLLDADITPGFSEGLARQWVREVKQGYSCSKCAFIAPLIEAKSSSFSMPANKNDLIKHIKAQNSKLQFFHVKSHAVVRYNQWTTTTEPYEVQYNEDMEPYFIIDHSTPLMNEMYAGYGRDKCAYSRDVSQSGYKFMVLPNAFLVNRKDPPKTANIYRRSKGVKFRMHLNIAFHKHDLDHGFLRYNTMSKGGQKSPNTSIEESCSRNNCDNSKSFMYKEETNGSPPSETETKRSPPGETKGTHDSTGECSEANDKSEESTDSLHDSPDESMHGGKIKSKSSDIPQTISAKDKCRTWLAHSENVDTIPFLPLLKESSDYREDRIAENLLRAYSVGSFIMLPKPKESLLYLYLPYTHPDSVITINPGNEEPVFQGRGMFYEYAGGKLSELLADARRQHSGAALLWVYGKYIKQDNYDDYLKTVLLQSVHGDIIVISGENEMTVRSLQRICQTHEPWEVSKVDFALILKSPDLPIFIPPTLPPIPDFGNGKCRQQDITTDLILTTRNRPMQTLAFLQSLHMMITGLNKVWVLYKADDNIFREGYMKVRQCMGGKLDIVLVDDETKGFGQTYLDLLNEMESDYVILAVDEMIWLRPVDLKVATCLLYLGHPNIASFQLRLGKNIGHYHDISNRDHRIRPVRAPGAEEIYLLFARRLEYDFGYVTNVDGTMMHKKDIIADLGKAMPNFRNPGQFENNWIRNGLHTRSRQWHLMYDSSRLVNNVLSTDGRVIGKAKPVEGSFVLAKDLIKNNKQIDFEPFIEKVKFHKNTHTSLPVGYKSLEC